MMFQRQLNTLFHNLVLFHMCTEIGIPARIKPILKFSPGALENIGRYISNSSKKFLILNYSELSQWTQCLLSFLNKKKFGVEFN